MDVVVKRAVDFLIAVPLLAVASPVILVAAAWIRLTSAGPAFFSQIRVGQNAVPFRCHKLRTMYAGTAVLPTHQVAADAVTPVGRTLRRLKVDEFPQLWNVLVGDMSLVGPRPCLPIQEELIEHRRRLGVYALKPGISGLAQVRGVDMSIPLACAEADAEYLNSRSVGLDLRILWRTVRGRKRH
jgi:O-antigen biosynthesis protein WbqP